MQTQFTSQIASANVASTQVALAIQDSSYAHVNNVQIQDFYYGVQLGNSTFTAKSSMFSDVFIETLPSGTCLSITPFVYDATFKGCTFQNPSAPSSGLNVVIDPSGGGGSSSIDTVIFDSCTSKTSSMYGLEIRGGQNIQVIGGSYSGNTTGGIGVTGPAKGVQIVGVSCVGPSEAGSAQQYGIYIDNGSDIQIADVNCSGTGTSGNGVGIYINGTSISDVRITNAICLGPFLGVASQQLYGMFVEGATQVLVDSCNLSGSTGATSYGLALQAVTNVTVSNCDLLSNAGGGLYVVGGSGVVLTTKVFVRDCNITGYSSYSTAVKVGTNVSTLEITNSAGYNDQAVPFSTPPAPAALFNGVTYGYYGPVTFYLWNSPTAAVTIDGVATTLNNGAYSLAPGQNAALSIVATNFLMVGT